MALLFLTFVAFLSLAWLGLMLLNLAGVLASSKENYNNGSGRKKVLAIVPCKGSDVTLEQNLISIKNQDCKNYKAVAVVDSKGDTAVHSIKKAGVDYIISSKSYRKGSGKVAAIITAMRRFRNFDIYVVIDSDVLCSKDHVSWLVAPLRDKSVGVSTAYPYFNPVGGFWSIVKMAWGFVGNGMMESRLTRFVWGGSMAFRKSLVGSNEFRMFEKAVSDDSMIFHFAKMKKLQIAYVNRHTIMINADDNFARFKEWSDRQTALSILGSRKVLRYGLLFYSAQALLLISGIALSFYSPWYLILLLPFAIGVVKTYRRSRRAYLSLLPISFMINFIFLGNLIKGASMHEIEWRGSRYRLARPF